MIEFLCEARSRGGREIKLDFAGMWRRDAGKAYERALSDLTDRPVFSPIGSLDVACDHGGRHYAVDADG
jgi:hypothetical protein